MANINDVLNKRTTQDIVGLLLRNCINYISTFHKFHDTEIHRIYCHVYLVVYRPQIANVAIRTCTLLDQRKTLKNVQLEVNLK